MKAGRVKETQRIGGEEKAYPSGKGKVSASPLTHSKATFSTPTSFTRARRFPSPSISALMSHTTTRVSSFPEAEYWGDCARSLSRIRKEMSPVPPARSTIVVPLIGLWLWGRVSPNARMRVCVCARACVRTSGL